MIEEMKLIQPFFVIQQPRFYQEIYRKYGISHFYTFQLQRNQSAVMMVPDGCVDIIFAYKKKGMRARIIGASLECHEFRADGEEEYFGVRFLPGYCPGVLDMGLPDLVATEYELSDGVQVRELLCCMENQVTFQHRIQVFLDWYLSLVTYTNMKNSHREILDDVIQIINDRKGQIKVHEIEHILNYTGRHINKIFKCEMGMSPKTFCRIVRFQRTLECLSYQSDVKLADVAVDYGYYDQAQFIKEFKHFCNLTPGEYKAMVYQRGFKEHVIDTQFLVKR